MTNNMLGNALGLGAEPLRDFFALLASSNGMVWLHAFKRFLHRENPWPTFVPQWEIMLGVHQSPEEYEQALQLEGKKIDASAIAAMKKVVCAKTQVTVRLASATIEELGFLHGGTTEQVHAAIKMRGGMLCSSEVGPALRLFFKDQPKKEWLWIAMDAIPVANNRESIFFLARINNSLELRGGNGRADRHWNRHFRIVFVVPV